MITQCRFTFLKRLFFFWETLKKLRICAIISYTGVYVSQNRNTNRWNSGFQTKSHICVIEHYSFNKNVTASSLINIPPFFASLGWSAFKVQLANSQLIFTAHTHQQNRQSKPKTTMPKFGRTNYTP